MVGEAEGYRRVSKGRGTRPVKMNPGNVDGAHASPGTSTTQRVVNDSQGGSINHPLGGAAVLFFHFGMCIFGRVAGLGAAWVCLTLPRGAVR